MKIGVAQLKPLKGNLQQNFAKHKKIIDLAINAGADSIFFPELSLAGYEPGLAKDLAIYPEDKCLDEFEKISNARELTIGVGMPIKNKTGICIGMVIFRPFQDRLIYAKKYLHPDEVAFFIPGKNKFNLIGEQKNIAPAICYEISVPAHSENVFNCGAEIYVASVAKSPDGLNKAFNTLSNIAKKYSMIVLLSNCIGECDGFVGGGKSSIWNREGILLSQLNEHGEGVLVINTETGVVTKNLI